MLDWLRSWDDVGEHRTGTEADELTIQWLSEECRRLGAHVELQRFDFERLEPQAASVDVGTGPLRGLPLFDAHRALRIRGPIGPVGSESPIGLVVTAPDGLSTRNLRDLRAGTHHRALVVVTVGGEPGLCPVNASDYPDQIGPPSLQVSSEHRAVLEDAADARREIAFEVELASRAVSAVNVVALIGASTTQASDSLTVLTPRTSWWRSTSERGGGIVCWLEILRSAAIAPGVGTIRLIATAGHELGHLGLKEFLSREPQGDRASPWLHLGANIGAVGGRITVRSPDASLARRLGAALDGHPDVVSEVSTSEPLSEAQLLHRLGERYVSVVGTSRWFHNERDRLENAVDLERLASIAAGIAGTAIDLADRRRSGP